MHKIILLTFLSSLFSIGSLNVTAQEKDKEKTGNLTYKLAAANHEYSKGNYRGALLLYREITKANPANANALFKTAECHYKLKKYDLALKYIDKAKNADPDVSKNMNFFYGQIYHRTEKIDQAISMFETFLETSSKRTIEHDLATRFLAQCNYAKQLMREPVNVEITNLGRGVNTRFDEYAPSITEDGKTIYFTSRRSDTEGGEIDEAGDYRFFEDIYMAKYDEEYGEWGDSVPLPGDVNSENYDAVLSVNPSGDEMFIYKNEPKLAGDIFLSQKDRKSENWLAPERMDKPINTSFYEGSISITNDGKTIYFISERPQGNGRGDIYVSRKKKDGTWEKPKNLGDVINTDDDEKFVFIHPNGKTLYFSSKGHQTMGSYDIFKSELLDGEWGTPVNLGYPINTANEESTFSLTRDNRMLFVSAEYEDSQGERDLYAIDVSEYGLISSGYDKSNYIKVSAVVSYRGSAAKTALVKFFNAESNRFIGEAYTDRDGNLRTNLPLDTDYKVEIIYGRDTFEKKLSTNDVGEKSVLKYSWSIP